MFSGLVAKLRDEKVNSGTWNVEPNQLMWPLCSFTTSWDSLPKVWLSVYVFMECCTRANISETSLSQSRVFISIYT